MSRVELIAKDRDRLLHRAARAVGSASVVATFLCLSVPGIVDWTVYLAALPLAGLLLFCLYRLGNEYHVFWVVFGILSGLSLLLVVQLPFSAPTGEPLATALVPLAGGALASFAIVLTGSALRLVLLGATFAGSITLFVLADDGSGLTSGRLIAVVVGWVMCGVLGYWLSLSIPRAARRIFSIGRAHRAERQASEIEAQRRQSARLLHDTVLATLTLLAHSGVGVSPQALRQQAGEDAQLLRQLRLGSTPALPSDNPDTGQNTTPELEDSALGTTLESVKHRFGRIGLEVSWHGTGQVLLPSEVLDAFLLALAECLENVRRHAGVTEAHVTITDDETTVRAMVTDSGVGFDVRDIDSARLGLKDSVIARLGEVGGNARLFSSPGSGTTVVLEVPK